MELSELIEAVDIVDFISQFVELEEKGDEYWGISPFTSPPEKTPSFSVRRESGKFYDFSSGLGGSVITFIKNYFHCGGYEAVEKLKKYANVDGEIIPRREKMAATLVCKKYRRPQPTKKPSHTTILPADYMLRYEKRDEKLAVWENEGISRGSLDRFQVFYDSFSDRLVYPIIDLNGNIVNIGGRTLDPQWKEKKQRKYSYFFGWNGGMDIIYGLSQNIDAIRERKEIIIFEGCKSVMLADSWGIKNTGALLTSHCNPNQMKVLASLGCRVVFALDKEIDVAADRNIKKLTQYVNVEYLRDTDDLLDPKDAPVDKGKEVFLKLYAARHRLQ